VIACGQPDTRTLFGRRKIANENRLKKKKMMSMKKAERRQKDW